MWDNTHLLVFALHWDYLQLLKYFHHLTITAINHGGRNCRVLNTKQKCCSTNQDLWIKRASTEVSRIQPNFSEPVRIHLWANSCPQVLIHKNIDIFNMPPNFTLTPVLDYPKQRTLIRHNFDCPLAWKIHFWQFEVFSILLHHTSNTSPCFPQTLTQVKKTKQWKQKSLKGQISNTHKSNAFDKHKTLWMLKQTIESVALLCSLTSVGFAHPETLLVLDLTGVPPPQIFWTNTMNCTVSGNKWWLHASLCTAK